jgi:hypothetical protein
MFFALIHSAQHFPPHSAETSHQRKVWWGNMTLTMALSVTLTLVLPVTLTLSSPPSCRRGGAVWEVFSHSVEMFPSREFFSWLISAPVRPSNLRMAIPGPPHSGESLASRVAARHASAFVLESRSSLHTFLRLKPPPDMGVQPSRPDPDLARRGRPRRPRGKLGPAEHGLPDRVPDAVGAVTAVVGRPR